MRISFIFLGVLFIVLGMLLYLVPTQSAATTIDNPYTGQKTFYASLSLPWQWGMALGIFGFILLVLGLALPDVIRVEKYPARNPDPEEYTEIHSKEQIDKGQGKNHILREKSQRVVGKNVEHH
jgi:uncharacterized membrane protein